MNTTQLKQNFHNLIDSIDNEKLLSRFYHIIKETKSAKEGELWQKLSVEEEEELLSALDESYNEDNLISNDQMKSKHKKWL